MKLQLAQLENRDTLDRAIILYATMLNRPAWINKDLREEQKWVWQRLVADALHHTGYEGVLTDTDFQRAIMDLLKDTSPLDILPPAIVKRALERSNKRAGMAWSIINRPADMTLADQQWELRDYLERQPDDIDNAVARFSNSVGGLVQTIEQSGFDADIIDPALAHIARVEAETIASVRP